MPASETKDICVSPLIWLCGGGAVIVPAGLLLVHVWTRQGSISAWLYMLALLAMTAGGCVLHLGQRVARIHASLQEGLQAYRNSATSFRLHAGTSGLTAHVANALQETLVSGRRRMDALTMERNTGQAVLDAMGEGVLAVDNAYGLMLMNPACCKLLLLDTQPAHGEHMSTAIRNADLQRLLREGVEKGVPIERELVVAGESDHYLQAHATPLCPDDGPQAGVLVVMRDVTRVKQLESMRQDFVANVSHELRTPITSIKGFVETLQALEQEETAARQRFLDIVARQADHLNAIVTDLLLLSSLEHDAVRAAPLTLQSTALDAIIEAAVEVVAQRAQQKAVQMDLRTEKTITFPMRPHLFEQAIVNLLDNAIKFSPEGGTVHIRTTQDAQEVRMEIADHGAGIERHHLERLFERFYRVDRGRNRAQGGTGLGLSIVKHIVSLHGGTVAVESTIGQGCLFRIVLPKRRVS